MTDPYRTLGVSKDADADAIRKAYRKLAKELHPDVNKDPKAADRFKQVNAANEILGDEAKRKLWDEFGEVSTRPGFDPEMARAAMRGGGGRGGFSGFPGGFGGGADVEDLLSQMFGGGGFGAGGGGQRRGQDQQVEIPVDFLSVVTGGEKQVQLRRPDGKLETVRVPIPAGAKGGGKVRLKGQGLPPRGGGPCGDLIVHLDVAEHPVLRRVDDDDLEMDVPVTVLEALKGASITVPTPTGDVNVKVPAGARSGARLRIKGKGIQKRVPGDLYLVLRPTVPASADPEVLAAAEKLEAAYDGPVRAALKL